MKEHAGKSGTRLTHTQVRCSRIVLWPIVGNPEASETGVSALSQYIELIIEPTFKDFEQNPRSLRHAYLACVATYHAVDRAASPRKPGALRKQWRKQSFEFTVVDMIAHKFKHMISDDEKAPTPKGRISLATAMFGSGALNSAPLNTQALNEGGIDLHNLYFVIRDAIGFLRRMAHS